MIDLSSSCDLKNAHFLVKTSYLKWTLNKACSYYLSYDTSIDSDVPCTWVEQNSSLMDIALKRANLFEAETEKFKLYQLSVQIAKPMIQACSDLGCCCHSTLSVMFRPMNCRYNNLDSDVFNLQKNCRKVEVTSLLYKILATQNIPYIMFVCSQTGRLNYNLAKN